MHDRRAWSVEGIERVLEGLSERGWEVGSLGRLVEVWEEVNGEKME